MNWQGFKDFAHRMLFPGKERQIVELAQSLGEKAWEAKCNFEVARHAKADAEAASADAERARALWDNRQKWFDEVVEQMTPTRFAGELPSETPLTWMAAPRMDFPDVYDRGPCRSMPAADRIDVHTVHFAVSLQFSSYADVPSRLIARQIIDKLSRMSLDEATRGVEWAMAAR